MTFTITPDTSVATVAQNIIDNHDKKRASVLLGDLYDKQVKYVQTSLAIGDGKHLQYAENIADIHTIAKAHNVRLHRF